MTTPLIIGIVLTLLGLACGGGLVAWIRRARRIDRPYARPRATSLVVAVGLAFTLMCLLIGVLILIMHLSR